MRTKSLVWLGGLLILALPTLVRGYAFITNNGTNVTWPAGTITMVVKADNAAPLSDGTTRAGSIQAAMQAWNAQIANVQFSAQIQAAASGTDHNGINEIFFSNTAYGQAWDSNTLAVTTIWYNTTTSRRTEGDIIFNTNFTWDSYRGPLQALEDVRRIALHELGHVLGLDHPDLATPTQFVTAIMNSTESDLDSLQPDDIAGAQALYGAPNVAPSFYFQPSLQTVDAGQGASFTAIANGNPAPSYKWQREPAGSGTWSNLSDAGAYSGTDTSTLTVSATTTAMSGDQFRCVATNPTGSATSSVATLTVNPLVAPIIFGLPGSVALYYGDTLSLYAFVGGTQPITYQWYQDGVAIPAATSSSFSKYNISANSAGQYTLVATNSAGSTTSAPVTVTATAPLHIARMLADPFRPLIYALQQDGTNAGTVLVLDPVTALPSASIAVGQKPTDLCISDDGNELLVICSASPSISVIDLRTLQVTGTIPLTTFAQWDPTGVATAAHIKYGPGNIIYYSDGNWAPIMRVFDRGSSTVLQSIQLDGSGPLSTGVYGFGDFVLSPDKFSLFAWGQYGWTAGSLNSAVAKFKINSDGTLTLNQTENFSYPAFNRDPLDTPALMAPDGSGVFIKQFVFSLDSVVTPIKSFPSPVYALSPRGTIATTATNIYDVSTGSNLYTLPSTGPIQAFSADSTRLVYFDPTARQLQSVDLVQAVGTIALGINLAPGDGSLVSPPSQLQWTPQAGISHYRVYLGTSRSAVAAATSASPEYLGEVIGSSITLGTPPAPGATYYWRVDAVSNGVVTPGNVYQFTVQTISASPGAINVFTVSGDKSQSVDLTLDSVTPGKTWSVTSSVPWITFDQASGTTPSTLKVKFDTTSLPTGLNQATVTITGTDGSFNLPVQLTVDPLALTVMRSVPGSPDVYAISEQNASDYSGTSRAYLLEIDTLFKRINRVARVGTGVTDLAVHQGDRRAYVTNWKIGSLLAVDLNTFALDRTYAFTPFGGVGYSSGDVYRVSAGGSGRLVIEPEDQWINISLFDTVAAASLATTFQREGGGAFDPSGRYYFHGDDNDSGAELHKIDTTGDKFVEVAHTAMGGGIIYGGDRTVVVPASGHQVFWNGMVFDENLVAQWMMDSIVYCASDDGHYAFGETKIYDVQQKQVVGNMPVSTKVSAFSSATGQLVLQNGTALQFFGLPDAVVGSTTPAQGAVVSSPSVLQWTPLAGATGYQVYLGSSASAVQAATTASLEYLGQVASNSFALTSTLQTGQTYYWRVDVVVGTEVATGAVHSFVVSDIIPSSTFVTGSTVQVDGNYAATIDLTSVVPGKAWSASASVPWITFAATSGTTPATVRLQLNATSLPVGLNQATVTITDAGGSFVLPVQLTVDPVALTIMRSAPGTTKVYAISEENAQDYSGLSRAYLLEIDTASKQVARVARVGTGVTDFALHKNDGQIYVTNWTAGSLLAIDLETFSLAQNYPFALFSSYGSNDVYRISAGGSGRLVVEPEDQWITVSLFDTAAGSALATINEREGGGAFDPAGRYYYHGDDNNSDASLHKLDTQGDHFLEVGDARPDNVLDYYGDRTVVMAENGHRIFWNGGVFDENLASQWTTGSIIYCTSWDGRYAFGANTIYDVVQKQVVGNMPVSTTVSAINSVTGQLVVQNGATIQFYSFPDARQPMTAARADFNGDGRRDILWSNTVTGDYALWLMNGTTVSANLFIATVPGWKASIGDFNGDGKADIFWSNTTTGDRAVWLMDGNTVISGSYIQTVPVDWVVSATGDFDGDGKTDILWTNTVTGERAVWLMNGTTLAGGSSLGTVPVEWTASAGDFNGDGKADIFWSNSTTGDRAVWLMNGTAVNANLFVATVPGWTASIGDFNGDGKADIFWSNTTTGDRAVWLMDGNTVIGGSYIETVPVAWVVSGTGDFDGDGKSDILWTNTITGERAIWLMNGVTLAGGASLGVVPIDWSAGN